MKKIWIVEDDPAIAGQLEKHLRSWNYDTRCAVDFQHITAEFTSFSPQLVLLDLALPFGNGFHWCAEIRRISSVPVIFISSAADQMNMVLAMSMGADDFIAKPFDLHVLTAKVQALLRRTYDFAAGGDFLEAGGVALNLADASVYFEGHRLELGRNEFRILQVLFENKGRITPRAVLMKRLWETDLFIDDNTLSVNIARLRKKLADFGAPVLIKTKKGVGYMVEEK